jgi:hypothetical protein
MWSKRQLSLKPSVHTREAVPPVLASCYGKRKTINNGEYLRICGQEFWYFISGNQHYEEELAVVINKFTAELSSDFCRDGKIEWNELVRFNSGNLKSN